jgi:hypothetical protein
VRIIKLDWTVFAEIEKDETANNDAIVIVVVAAFWRLWAARFTRANSWDRSC